MIKKTITQKINEIAEDFFSGNNVLFASKLETSEANIRNYRSGTMPKLDFIVKLSEKLEISYEWLLSDEGAREKKFNSMVAEPSEVYKLRTDRVMEDQAVPLYNIEAAAGIVTLFRDTAEFKPVDYIQVPNLPKCDGAVYVSGDSMYPLLKSGDIVMYKQHDLSDGIIWGEMYLISYEHAGDAITSVKYIKRSEFGKDYIKLVSQNQHHQDRDIEVQKVTALALVKASIRINSMS